MDEGKLLSVSKVAAVLGVTGTTVRRWVSTGKLAAVVLPGGSIRVKESTLKGILEEAE